MKTDSQVFMQLAIYEAKKSPEGSPKVGAIIVKEGQVVASAYRGKCGAHLHAEQCAISEAKEAGIEIKGAKVYTTLEPCNVVKSTAKTPCADQLIDAGVHEVCIGSYGRNPAIYRQGWKKLRDAGIKIQDFDALHRQQVIDLNRTADGNFLFSVGFEGGAKFDYMQNGGKFELYMR